MIDRLSRIEQLRADARELELAYRAIAPDPDWIPGAQTGVVWSCTCRYVTRIVEDGDPVLDEECEFCGTFPSAETVTVDPIACPNCFALMPGHGRGCYLDETHPYYEKDRT